MGFIPFRKGADP